MKIAFLLVLLFVVAAVATKKHEHPHGHHNHHMGQENGKHHQQQCAYTSTQGFEYDLRMLQTALRERDWKVYNADSKSTFHLNPCGSVHVPGCPEGSAVCEVSDKQEAINFGTASGAIWADATGGNTFEITFGNGELCNNGVPRKSVVTFQCAVPTQGGPFRTHVSHVDEERCEVNIVVESPHACPVPVFCGAIHQPEVCGRTEDLCFWRQNKCVPSSSSWLHRWAARHHVSPTVFLACVGLGSFLMSCSLALCFCACCRAMKQRRMCKRSTLPTTRKCKKAKQPKKVEEEIAPVAGVEAIPMEELPAQGVYVYQPLQQQLQDVYAAPMPQGGYGFHMVQFVPAQHLQYAEQ